LSRINSFDRLLQPQQEAAMVRRLFQGRKAMMPLSKKVQNKAD
jgi:hypothetical protein